MRQLDILFINTNSANSVYQKLAEKWAAVEPPTWSLLLAQSCRAKGYGVGILDAQAERMTNEETANAIIAAKPKFACFVTYGQNPNAGTTNMVGVYKVAELVKEANIRTISVGSHTSALPHEVLSNKYIDYVTLNEGVYAIHKLLEGVPPCNIPGLGYYWFGKPQINNGLNSLVPQERMDIDLPGYAWDLLPYREKPFDLYRAHLWHAEYQDEYRTPFAAIYSSLGCQFKCNFCMINTINRTDAADGITAANSNMMRFWSPELILKEFDKLVDYGISTIRISDEMFFLNKKYYEPLLLGLKEKGYGEFLKMWTYARVDTVNEKFLDLFRAGGVKWLALGIEAANQDIRRELYKGKFQNINIRDVVKEINNHGLYSIANYIFGHPNDNLRTMQETLDLALELNTESVNMYTAMALPGSPLYYEAKENNWKLPDSADAWSFHSYKCQPLPTHHCTAEEVLKFRDDAWHTYFESPKFLSMIEQKFGEKAVKNLREQSIIRLKRKILE